MRRYLIAATLIAETGILLRTAYVAYRWVIANAHPTHLFDLYVPYFGGFERIVAPWVFGSLFIPLCWLVLLVANRFRRRPISN